MKENKQVLRILARVFGSILAVATFSSIIILISSTYGISSISFVDLISFFIVVIIPYFLMVASSGSIIFFLKKEDLKAFGNLMLAFGFIGFLIGLVLTFQSMGQPAPAGVDPLAPFGQSFAICLLPILYGLFMKYFIIFPIQHGIEDES